eukprot:9355580-Lingulodinium_polyedra.AAC.1
MRSTAKRCRRRRPGTPWPGGKPPGVRRQEAAVPAGTRAQAGRNSTGPGTPERPRASRGKRPAAAAA